MRLLVFFDLPTDTKEDRRNYRIFRQFLIRDGYDMIQFSVYARICNGSDRLEKHIARLSPNVPAKGSVRYMQITEKQFTGMGILVGKKKRAEKAISASQLSFF